jgi:hypothetical protein
MPAGRADAQTVVTTGTIRGKVSDQSGAAFPASTVILKEMATGKSYGRQTNHEGIFVFSALPVGTYGIRISAPGFKTTEIQSLVVQVGQTTAAAAILEAGATDQTVIVTAATPLLRPTESTLSTVITRSLLDGLPLSGRRYTDFALLTPNASPDGQSGLVSFAGEQGGEDSGYANGNGANSFTVDGASATSMYFGNARGGERVPYIFGENAIQEFQVAVTPYSASYGGGATGFLNTVTKSGTDTYHGNAFYYNRNSGTGANDAVDKAAGIPRPVDILQQFGAAAGGPIVHHRAWFFFDFEQQLEADPISVVNPAFQQVNETNFDVPAGTTLPAPNGPLPVPGPESRPDPSNPIYLQQVSNSLYAIDSNLGTHSRYRNDLALFTKLDYEPAVNDRLYLSLNMNRFNSPNGEITETTTPLFGISTLANSFVRDYQASAGWTHTFSDNLLNDFHFSFSRGDQYATPTGLVPPNLASILLTSPEEFELGNAGFANGRTNEAQWEWADGVDYVHGKHSFKFGVEANYNHVTDSAFGGFDPDAVRQNGTLAGTYSFSTFPNFALGIYNSLFQSAGKPTFTFDVPYVGFYAQDTYQVIPRLTLDLGLREDFQIYPQPAENPAFPLTGQFPNQYMRLAPRVGFAWQPIEKTVVRGGFGMFYENFNGLNYRNSVISNGLSSQQASVSAVYNPALPPNQQTPSSLDGVQYGPVFPNSIPPNSPLFTGSSDISIVDPGLRDPYVIQSGLQIEREILPQTTISIGTLWTHGVHLISGTAYDLNQLPPQGLTTYIICPPGTTDGPCTGRKVVLPNLDSNLLQDGLINPNLGQINALISPGINNYNSLFVQFQRRYYHGLAVQAAYTYSKNITSNGVDFNNQFDFSNTHSPSLLDQRHRLIMSAMYQPFAGRHFESKWANGLLTNWTISSVALFSSGRPYAPLLDTACTSSTNSLNNCDNLTGTGDQNLNDSAYNQATANSALGINGSGPTPGIGLNSFYGPWTQQVDLALSRLIRITERQSITLQAQAFNLFNYANFYVQSGNGINQLQYEPVGQTCGDGVSKNQTCYLVPNSGPGGFGSLQIINALNGPRVLQFAFKYNF